MVEHRTEGNMIYLFGSGTQNVPESSVPAHLENRMNEDDESFLDANQSMQRIRKRVNINGTDKWLTANSVDEWLEKFYEETKSHHKITVEKHNFAGFVAENWKHIKGRVLIQTVREYEIYLNNDILPYFGDMNIEDITWREIQDFYDLFSHRARQTVHKRKIVLSMLMQIAVGDGIITIDPTRNRRLVYSKIENERPVPSQQEFHQYVSAINNLSQTHYRLYMALIVYTGMRKGEALALRWEDVSFSEKMISIKQSARLDKNKNGEAVIKPPKTKAGIRDVPLIKPLEDILYPLSKEKGYIVTDSLTNEPIHSDAKFNTMMRYIRNEMDLGKYTSHSFRHAVATLYIASGVDIKTVQTIIGHSKPSTTLNIYAHAVPSNIVNAGRIFTEQMLQ